MPLIRATYLFLAAYLPFESYIGALLFRSPAGVLYLKQFSDLLILLTFFLFLTIKIFQKDSRVRDLVPFASGLALIFVIFSIASTVANGGDMVVGLLQNKATLRYVLVALVIANIGFSHREWSRLGRLFSFAVLLNVAMAAFQMTAPEASKALNPFYSIAGDIDASLISTTVLEGKSGNIVSGAALNTIEFAFMLAAWWIVRPAFLSGQGSHVGYYAFVLFAPITGLLLFTGSRIAVIAFALCGLFYFSVLAFGRSMMLGKFLSLVFLIFGAALAAVEAGITDLGSFDFFSFTSLAYLETAKLQRLGIVITYFEIASQASAAFLFGLGSDPTNTVDLLASRGHTVPYLLQYSPASIEDVYWLSLLIFNGIFGAGALFTLLIIISYQSIKAIRQTTNPSLRRVSVAVSGMLLFTAITGVFNQVLEVKQFSFYLWVLVGYWRFLASRAHPSRALVNGPSGLILTTVRYRRHL